MWLTTLGGSIFIYVATFIFSVSCIYFSEKKQVSSKLFSFIGILIPTITATFRQSGIDYNAYKKTYYLINSYEKYDIEFGWLLLNKISPSYEGVLFLSALLFLGITYLAIKKLVKRDLWIAWYIILIVCYGTFYNAMRQMLAVAFVFLAISYILNKKYIKFLLFIICAVQFHKSAIFMLVIIPVYVWISKKIKRQELFILALSILCCLGTPILISVLGELGIYTSYLYMETKTFSLGFILYSIPPLIFYYKRKYLFKDNIETNSCVGLYLLLVPFQFIGISIAFADRIMLYFQIIISVIVPKIIAEYDNLNSKHSLRYMYLIWFTIHYLVIGIMMNGNGCYPYRMFLL